MSSTTRQRKTPAQRAQEQLDIATRAVERLTVKRTTLATELEEISAERDAAIARRDHLAQHPDLQPADANPRAGSIS